MKDLMGRERRGEWMLTISGKMFFPLDPREDEVDIRDIARGLAMACRYNGHVTRFYSVAEHSVLVMEHTPEPYKLQALMHDATEAYLGDMIRPLKEQPELSGFVEAEDALEPVIFKAFKIVPTYESTAIIKSIDTRILLDEQRVRAVTPHPWHGLDGLEPLGANVQGLYWDQAEQLFLGHFMMLIGMR